MKTMNETEPSLHNFAMSHYMMVCSRSARARSLHSSDLVLIVFAGTFQELKETPSKINNPHLTNGMRRVDDGHSDDGDDDGSDNDDR
jgi:hypothetical protein